MDSGLKKKASTNEPQKGEKKKKKRRRSDEDEDARKRRALFDDEADESDGDEPEPTGGEELRDENAERLAAAIERNRRDISASRGTFRPDEVDAEEMGKRLQERYRREQSAANERGPDRPLMARRGNFGHYTADSLTAYLGEHAPPARTEPRPRSGGAGRSAISRTAHSTSATTAPSKPPALKPPAAKKKLVVTKKAADPLAALLGL